MSGRASTHKVMADVFSIGLNMECEGRYKINNFISQVGEKERKTEEVKKATNRWLKSDKKCH